MSLNAGSLAHQIAALACGETVSRSRSLGLSQGGLHDEIREAKRKMRNHLNKHADRAGRETGNQYRMDSGVWLANEDSAVFVTVTITRIT